MKIFIDDWTQRQQAIFYMNLNCLLSAIQFTFVKMVTSENDVQSGVLDVCFFKTIILFAFSWTLVKFYGQDMKQIMTMESHHKNWIVIRIVTAFLGQSAMLQAAKLLPITTLDIITNLTPFFVVAFSFLVLQEYFTNMDIVGVLLSFIGVAIFIMDKENDVRQSFEHGDVALGVTFSAVCVLMGALTVISLRGLKDVHHSIVIFYYSVFAMVYQICWMILDAVTLEDDEEAGFKLFSQPFYPNWTLLLGSGILYSCSMVCKTIAYQRDKSSLMSLVNYGQLVFSMGIDKAVFGTQFLSSQMFGALVVLFNTILTIYINLKEEKPCKNQNKNVIEVQEAKFQSIQSSDDNEITQDSEN